MAINKSPWLGQLVPRKTMTQDLFAIRKNGRFLSINAASTESINAGSVCTANL